MVRNILSLLKYKVSLAVSFTAVSGYLLCSGRTFWGWLGVMAGVFLMAGGAGAFNQIQERKPDGLMNRTRNRVLPGGTMGVPRAVAIATLASVSGFAILWLQYGPVSGLLGLFNLLWYNLFYTNLKRVTAMAVLPGAITGAVPAYIGWTAAGGYLFDARIMWIGFFLFIWQVPHFWLLLMKYTKEYEQAGYPSIYRIIRRENLKYVSLVWVLATSGVSLLFPLFGVIRSLPLLISVFILNLGFVYLFTRITFRRESEINFKLAFAGMNAYMLLFMLLAVAFETIW